jgi:hypothetical protein
MGEKKQLTTLQIIGYGTGHIFNDICASMWFTYFLLFFQDVSKVLFPFSSNLFVNLLSTAYIVVKYQYTAQCNSFCHIFTCAVKFTCTVFITFVSIITVFFFMTSLMLMK